MLPLLLCSVLPSLEGCKGLCKIQSHREDNYSGKKTSRLLCTFSIAGTAMHSRYININLKKNFMQHIKSGRRLHT